MLALVQDFLTICMKEGAKIVTHEQAWEADLVIKVKEPHESEYQYFKRIKLSGDFYI